MTTAAADRWFVVTFATRDDSTVTGEALPTTFKTALGQGSDAFGAFFSVTLDYPNPALINAWEIDYARALELVERGWSW